MLTGHESLLRVIGKRRRFLPNRCSVLSSSSTSQSCLSICTEEENVKRESVEEKADNGDAAEVVYCPVCGARIPGLDNTLINSHLDVCLAKGSKRKLSQVTLFQLNFSRSKAKVHSSETADIGNQVVPAETNDISTCDASHYMNESCTCEEYGNICHSVSCGNNSFASCIENLVSKDISQNKIASPPVLLDIERPQYFSEDAVDGSDISKVLIPTLIVGRRYGSREELVPESRICLSRDPGNVKDPNAIKVLSVGCENDNMLGYIPRELAQYLSPLMDKFHVNFEGSIISVPKDSRAAVPIQMVSRNVEEQIYWDNNQYFKSLWRQALHVVELAKTNSSGMTGYHYNVVLIIEEVLKSNPHLFTNSEMSFLEAFILLPDDSKRLFARLYTRKGPWFRMSSISYPEIADCHQASKGLLEAGYLCSFSWRNELEDNDFEILNILNMDELREALRMLKKHHGWFNLDLFDSMVCAPKSILASDDYTEKDSLCGQIQKCNQGARKQDIINLLLSSSRDVLLCSELQSFVSTVTGSCIRVSAMAESLIWRAERLFFLNGEQDLSSFLLVDLGIVKYPAYRCIITQQIFSNRSNWLSYEEAIEVSQIMVESLDENNSEFVLRCIEISVTRMLISSEEDKPSSGSLPAFFSHFSASWIYSKVVILGVSFLEREKRYMDAINLLRQLLNTFVSDRRRGYWTLRLSVDLEHLGRLDDSLKVAEDGILDPWVRAGSRIALQRRVLRLGKPPRRWKIPSYSTSIKRKIFEVHVQGRPLNCKTGMKSIFYGEDGERCGVEQLALQYYAGEGGGWQGVHAESGIWLTIFGILMWDITFADIPNAFWTKFQTAPLDLESDSFYESRISLIEELLEKIKDGMAEEILITSWESHVGTACRGVNWDKHSLVSLRAAVKCIGGPCLASICRHLAQDYHSWSSGMPDLLLWRLHDCYRGEAKLVEVKGPRDRLSEQQRAWLLLLMDCGFSVEVCKVSPAPVVT